MKEVFGYIRVSTARQGEKGVSLIEQQRAIEQYAARNNFRVTEWFEERETAAKQGRAVFKELIKALKKGHAAGVVAHKIDRSARNLRDWADLVDLADQGIEVHFSNESIDLQMRGGRLSADIQAVVAADYIRNLREEALKGLRGRLKQGFYPWQAPIGYLDKGGGKTKEIDPVKGPLVAKGFELYASGNYSLKTMAALLREMGLTNLNDRMLSKNNLSRILNNSFYYGVMKIGTTNEVYLGNHEPLISKKQFDQVQAVLQGRTVRTTVKKLHRYRTLFTCVTCQRHLIGELQKGHVYYRCHLCRGVCIRQESIERELAKVLANFELCEHALEDVQIVLEQRKSANEKSVVSIRQTLQLKAAATAEKLERLTDLLLDGTIDKETYLIRKEKNINELNALKYSEGECSRKTSDRERNLERYKDVFLAYQNSDEEETRKLIQELTSNRSVQQKNVVLELHSPFKELCDLKMRSCCPHRRTTPRTFSQKKHREHFRAGLLKFLREENDPPGSSTQSP